MASSNSLFFDFPDTSQRLLFACLNTGHIAIFGFAGGTCVSDFFAVLFRDCGYHFVFEVDEHGLHLQGTLRAALDAFAAAVAFFGVNYDVVFA